MELTKQRLEFCELLLGDIAPDETEFAPEYVKAAGHWDKPGSDLGPEFGITEAAVASGPVVVWIGLRVFDLIMEWGGAVAKKTIEGFIVDRGKEKLKSWLSAPKSTQLAGALTHEGKKELLALISKLAVQARLKPDEAARVTERVASIVLGGDDKR